MSSIPNFTKSYFYIVKDISVADKAAARTKIESATVGADTYDILEYIGAYTFDTTETYFEELTFEEQEIAILSPIFWDIVTEINDPATHDEAHDKIRPFAANDEHLCYKMMDDLKISLHYVIGNPIFPTEEDLQTGYNNTLLPLIIDLKVGDVAVVEHYVHDLTGAGLATDTGLGTADQWEEVLHHLHDMIDPFLRKFPR